MRRVGENPHLSRAMHLEARRPRFVAVSPPASPPRTKVRGIREHIARRGANALEREGIRPTSTPGRSRERMARRKRERKGRRRTDVRSASQLWTRRCTRRRGHIWRCVRVVSEATAADEPGNGHTARGIRQCATSSRRASTTIRRRQAARTPCQRLPERTAWIRTVARSALSPAERTRRRADG